MAKALFAATSLALLLMLFGGAGDDVKARALGSRRSSEYRATGNLLYAGGFFLEPEGGGSGEVEAAGEDELLPGDILLGRCNLSFVPSLNPVSQWTHASIYLGDNEIMDAGYASSVVTRHPLRTWMYPDMTWVVYLRVASADQETRGRVVKFAREQQGKPYDINWLSKQADGESWYCSEFVWAAYLQASGGTIDLVSKPELLGVSPDDIYNHPDTEVIGGHFERKPETILSIFAKLFVVCIMAKGLMIMRLT